MFPGESGPQMEVRNHGRATVFAAEKHTPGPKRISLLSLRARPRTCLAFRGRAEGRCVPGSSWMTSIWNRAIADVCKEGHSGSMKLRYRHAEVLSSDGKLRLAIYDRDDHMFQIVEERVRSYEAEDEDHFDFVPFPTSPNWHPSWQIDSHPQHGLFGTVSDAVAEAVLRVESH